MSKMVLWFRKMIMVGVVVSLSWLSWPTIGVQALGSADPLPPTPPAAGQISTDRLKAIWAREQWVYGRIGNLLERADTLIPRIQNRIDRAKANGKDVSAVQAALDAFSAAIRQVHPIYESSRGIIASHQGFDDQGNVIDPVTALATVKDLRSKIRDMRQAIGGTLRDLREAIQAFRQANPPPGAPSPTPGG